MSTNPSFIDRVLNRVGLGEFTSPGISSDQTVEVEGYTLPKDFQRIIREGEALQALVASDGWKIILDRLEAEFQTAELTARHAEEFMMEKSVMFREYIDRDADDADDPGPGWLPAGIVATPFGKRKVYVADHNLRKGKSQ